MWTNVDSIFDVKFSWTAELAADVTVTYSEPKSRARACMQRAYKGGCGRQYLLPLEKVFLDDLKKLSKGL